MGLPELRNKIQLQIENADERILKIVSSIFDNYQNDLGLENGIHLSEAEKRAVDEAISQVERAETQSHNLVMEETKAKYSKYFNNED